LRSGGFGVFPTDTAYGVGCRMDNEGAVKWVFDVKKRNYDEPVPVLVDSVMMAKGYVSDEYVSVFHEVTGRYWPGALTVVVPCKRDLVNEMVRGGGDKIGMRMPDNDICLELIKGVGVPIIGTSANFHGKVSVFSFEDLDEEFTKLVDFVIKGECRFGKASTVLDISTEPFNVLRQGAVEVSL